MDALSDDDLRVLGFGTWITGLEDGFAAHHAGLVPPFKEAVERCFLAGLVKVVFATETLALGINMPARSVVIEKLTKFTGERHEFLTPGEYTQLTGRAGRRGIDDVGYAIVLWSPFVPFDQSAPAWPAPARTPSPAASGRPTTWPPTWSGVTRPTWPTICSTCPSPSTGPTATWSASKPTSNAPWRLLAAGPGQAAACERGDVEKEYRKPCCGRARTPAGSAASMTAGRARPPSSRCGPGDVPEEVVPGGRSGGRVAVLSTTRRRGGDLRLRAITPDRRVLSLGPGDFPAPPRALARVELPAPYAPNNTGFQRHVASALSAARLREDGHAERAGGGGPPRPNRPAALAMAQAESAAVHPVAGCPDVLPAPAGASERGGTPGPRRRTTRGPYPGSHGVPGPSVRPGPARPRGMGLRRRMGPDAGGGAAGPGVPRGRPARRRVRPSGPPRRSRPTGDGRPGLRLHVRVPGSRRGVGHPGSPRAGCGTAGWPSTAWPQRAQRLPRTRPACRSHQAGPTPEFIALALRLGRRVEEPPSR